MSKSHSHRHPSRVSVRAYLIAGVSVVGAGVLAASPVAPPAPTAVQAAAVVAPTPGPIAPPVPVTPAALIPVPTPVAPTTPDVSPESAAAQPAAVATPGIQLSLLTGSTNLGAGNVGDFNTGIANQGVANTGAFNDGNFNIGGGNVGDFNIGVANEGNFNVGIRNKGDYNVGAFNIGIRYATAPAPTVQKSDASQDAAPSTTQRVTTTTGNKVTPGTTAGVQSDANTSGAGAAKDTGTDGK